MKQLLFNFKWRLYKPRIMRAFSEAQAYQYFPSEHLEVLAENKRRKIVRHAVEHTAFYRKFYGDVGFELGDMESDGWFERLPVLKKEHLREYFDQITDQGQVKYRGISTTGGSTGTPTRTGYDLRLPQEVMSWRFQRWFNVNPWDDHAYVWRQTRSPLSSLVNTVIWWPTRHLKLDASFMTEDQILKFFIRYNRLRPSLLEGYVGAITQLAQLVLEKGLRVHSPKCVWVTSAPISEVQKNMIREAFHAPILNQYGSCEIASIAQSCPADCGLHVNVDRVCLEYVDEQGKPVPAGGYGRALLTNLVDTVFPMIRYENGDRGRWLKEKCPCGRTLPMIDSVKGRESESFVLPSGRTVNGEFLTTIFDATPNIARGFKVVQHKDLSITVQCIPTTGRENEVKSVVAAFASKIGNEVNVTCEFVTEIPHDRGKLRFVVREK